MPADEEQVGKVAWEIPLKTIACSAPYGSGGLGQHLAQVVEDARSDGTLGRYFTSSIKRGDSAGRQVSQRGTSVLLRYTPARCSPGWKNYLAGELFDRDVAARLEPAHVFTGFGGQALHSFRQARRGGSAVLELVAANSHVNNVWRQHAKAIRAYNLERSWLNEAQRRKTLREYDMADIIYVASEYTRHSFLREGIAAAKLHKCIFKAQPHFIPAPAHVDDGLFHILYTGSLTIFKGVPVLLEAFARFAHPDAQLTLVGGWATRGMRRYLQGWQARDPRIHIAPGNPLPYLQQAHVYVHPTYEDGFSYAPMEALASGVPVIVTEDTGMRDHVQEGVNGYIVPTGDVGAIVERLEALWRSPLSGGQP